MYDPQKHKEYYAKNRERKIKNTIAYTKKRIKEDPKYKHRHVLGIKLSTIIRSIKGADEFLGCDIIYFIKHIENQFDESMNWNNHGSVWELDHIKPSSSFNLLDPEEQKRCYHYTNLQPLEKTKNRNKLNKYE